MIRVNKDLLSRAFDPAKLATVRSTLQAFVDGGELAGIVTLTSRAGEIVQSDALGWSDIETGAPMRPDSLFRIASMTKPVTGVAILMLIFMRWSRRNMQERPELIGHIGQEGHGKALEGRAH